MFHQYYFKINHIIFGIGIHKFVLVKYMYNTHVGLFIHYNLR